MEDKSKYPIGKFTAPKDYPHSLLSAYISDIENLPAKLREEVSTLLPEQLEVPYRHGGWNIRQVVHHLADSHMNALVRVKLALTEKKPTIKPYNEHDWAELSDVAEVSIQTSLAMIDAIHEKLICLLRSLKDEQWQKAYVHPEMGRSVQLTEVAGIYAWHGRHHLAHITTLKQKKDWK